VTVFGFGVQPECHLSSSLKLPNGLVVRIGILDKLLIAVHNGDLGN